VDAFILGAGFSRAVGDAMPLTSDLAEALKTQAEDELFTDETCELVAELLPKLFGTDVEQWLSFLQGGGPYLTELERLRYRAAALELVEGIVQEIRRAEAKIWSRPLPPWVSELAAHWHRDCSAVVSLNYDTIVERAGLQFRPAGTKVALLDMYCYPMASLRSRRGEAVFGSGHTRTYRLAKLHGSVNWLREPGQPAASTMPFVDAQLNPTADQRERIWELSQGLSPVILPPAMTKANFYDESLIRAQWTYARAAIEEADRLFIVGCSLRPADFDLSNLLSVSLRGPSHTLRRFSAGRATSVFVVDISDNVLERTRQMGIDVDGRLIGSDPLSAMSDFLATA